MPDISISDSQAKPLDLRSVNWGSASSLFNYLKSEGLHLLVAPDYIAVKDKILSQAAPTPKSFRLTAQHEFELGGSVPEVDLTPDAKITLTANAAAGSDLFDDDSFHTSATIPPQTGYVGMSFGGALDLNVSGYSGDLTFGIDANAGITLEFFKAFPTGANEPTLWNATAALLSNFVIPATLDDLKRLGTGDVCTVSGQGCLSVFASVNVSVPVNPLASVNLPLNGTTLAIRDGAMAGLSVSFTLSGSYQIRVEKQGSGAIRLSYLRDRDTSFEVDLSGSAGVKVDLGSTDILSKLLGTIGTGKADPTALNGLTSDEVSTFTSAIKAGVNHSLQVALNTALSASKNSQVTFQYEIQPGQLDAAASNAVNRALKGDLTLLTALEHKAAPDGTIAPGVKLLNSVLTIAKTQGISLKVNLLGIVNLISSTQLISNCEFLFEPASGDLTIKETAESDRISAITDPYKRQQALRKAMFESVLATTAYVVGKAVTLPTLKCEAVHFVSSANTNRQQIADWTNWLVVLNLMQSSERAGILSDSNAAGVAACTVRATLDDSCSEAMFFNGQDVLRGETEYQEIGRQALKSLLNPVAGSVDQYRYNFLNDDNTWRQAVQLGPCPALNGLIPLPPGHPAVADIGGDVCDILWWASSMTQAGRAIQAMRAYLAGRDPAALANDPGFANLRNALQKLMLKVVGESQMRFDEPWGLVCLFRAGGSRVASGKITAPNLTIDRTTPAPAVLTATTG